MNKQSSKASLFLIELVLSIFFFIIATVICLQLFVKSYQISQQTIEANHAVLWSQNLAETFLGSAGDYNMLKNIYSENDCISDLSLSPENHLLLCFDEDWNLLQSIHNSTYIVFSVYRTDDSFAYQDIYIAKNINLHQSDFSASDIVTLLCRDDVNIYQLTVKKMISNSVKGGSP